MMKNFFVVAIWILSVAEVFADQDVTYDATWAVQYAMNNYNIDYSPDGGNQFENFGSGLGGNCTNFASQVLVAGFIKSASMIDVYNARHNFDIDKVCYGKYIFSGVANGGCTTAWYYNDSLHRGPAWTDANKLHEYAKNNSAEGVHFSPVELANVQPGDFIFVDYGNDDEFEHTMIVTNGGGMDNITITNQSVGLPSALQSHRPTLPYLNLSIIISESPDANFQAYRPVSYNVKNISECSFSDVSETDYSPKFLCDLGIVNGYEDGTFKISSEINRAEFLKIVLKSADKITYDCSSISLARLYSDVSLEDWFCGYVDLANNLGVASGYGDGSFGPEKPTLKGEAAKMITRAFSIEEPSVSGDWYAPFVSAISSFSGDIIKSENAGEKLKRGEMAIVMDRAIHQQ